MHRIRTIKFTVTTIVCSVNLTIKQHRLQISSLTLPKYYSISTVRLSSISNSKTNSQVPAIRQIPRALRGDRKQWLTRRLSENTKHDAGNSTGDGSVVRAGKKSSRTPCRQTRRASDTGWSGKASLRKQPSDRQEPATRKDMRGFKGQCVHGPSRTPASLFLKSKLFPPESQARRSRLRVSDDRPGPGPGCAIGVLHQLHRQAPEECVASSQPIHSGYQGPKGKAVLVCAASESISLRSSRDQRGQGHTARRAHTPRARHA